MRTTDSDPKPYGPLGERVIKPVPVKPEWTPKPGSPGIEQNAKGELRTNIPLPKA